MEHNYSDNNDRKSYRILVVDDEQDLCEILRFNLEAEGYQVSALCRGLGEYEGIRALYKKHLKELL